MLGPLEAYFRLLAHWNAKINLTSLPLNEPSDAAFDRLLVEPLAAARQVPDASSIWYDLGSGGGSPAIPLKIARPMLKLTMIESKERKAAFLREAIRTLGLTETTVVNERFEDTAETLANAGIADLVTVRAVKPDAGLFAAAGLLLKADGRLLLFRPAHAASMDPPGFTRMSTMQLTDMPAAYLSSYRRVFHVEQSR
jgi:16S rRNA (guanine527-N7)-methyltransferase